MFMRHEKISIVALSYVIGFTAALIAFGLNDTSSSTAPIVMATPANNGTQAAQVISALTEATDYHYDVISDEVSPDEHYVVYCAQSTVEDEICGLYVYDLLTAAVYLVNDIDNSQQVGFPLDEVNALWGSDNKLYTPDLVSVSTEEPWLMVERN